MPRFREGLDMGPSRAVPALCLSIWRTSLELSWSVLFCFCFEEVGALDCP